MRIPSFFRLPQDPIPGETAIAVNSFYRFFGLTGNVPFDHDRCVLSPYIKPVYLGVIRFIFGLYMLTCFIVYFTILACQKNKFLQKQAWKLLGDIMFHSFLGMTAYFLVSGYHTLEFGAKRRNPLATWSRPLQLAHLILQTTVLTFPLFCTVIYVYWTLPALPAWHTRPLTRWSTITFFILNSVFSFIELGLSASRPRPWSHLIIVVLLLGLYLAFHSILVAATRGKVWIYTVLKFSLVINRGSISAWRTFGLCVLATVSFCVMQLILWVKCRYLGGLKLRVQNNLERQEPHKIELRLVRTGSQESRV
jgi:hypothetical protein